MACIGRHCYQYLNAKLLSPQKKWIYSHTQKKGLMAFEIREDFQTNE